MTSLLFPYNLFPSLSIGLYSDIEVHLRDEIQLISVMVRCAFNIDHGALITVSSNIDY